MTHANSLTMDRPVPISLLDDGAQDLIGRPIDRVDGPRKVSGTATYAAEYAIDGLVHGVLVQSTIGAGTIVSIDPSQVLAMPGVIDVVIDLDRFARAPQEGAEEGPPPQGVREIVYFGQPIALVVADSFETARDAAERLTVHYETRQGAYDFAAQRNPDKPADGNIPAHYEQGDIDAALSRAAVTIDQTFTTPSQNSAAMEPHASIAVWNNDALTLYGSYQMLPSNVKQLSKALGVAEDKVRIVSRFVGGGFGSKLGIAPESVAAAIAAKKLRRPVKVVLARTQVFDATMRRMQTEQRVRLGADHEGRLSVIAHETLGSNLTQQDFFEPAGISTHLLYAGENRRITHDLIRLNLVQGGSMRAPGEAVGMLALEGAMDELAEAIGIDPIELRRRNEPYQDPEKDVPFSSRRLIDCLEDGARRFGWEKRQARPGTVREGEWLVGMGVSAAARPNMLMKASASVTLAGDGRAVVESSMTDIGTGSYTILTQIAGEMLGLPVDRIDMILGDSALPPAAGSGGSFGACSSGSAVYLACENLRGQLAARMGVAPDDLTLKDGQVIGDNRSVPITDLIGEGLTATGDISPGKQERLTSQASFGAHFAEVAVNATSGEVRVRRMLGVFAAGRILNPRTARSQCLGGMTFGIGAALEEALIHDAHSGKLVNHDLSEYHIPVNADVPQIEVHFLDERDVHTNPIHAKGIGELGISGAGASIANAIYNACGVRVRDFPLTLDKLLPGLPPV